MPSGNVRLQNVKAKWHNLVEVDIPKATEKFLRIVFSKRFVWIIVVLLAGLALHEGRNLFYYLAPLMIKHSHLTVVVVNAVIIDFFGTITAIKLIVAGIDEGLRLATGGKFPHNMPKLKHIVEPQLLNAAELRQYLKEVVTSCNQVDTGWHTVETYLRAQFSYLVCPLLRAATPLGAIGEAVQKIGSPFSFDPSPQGNNCEAGDFDKTIADTCMLVNSGVVALHVVLPLMIAVIFFGAYFRILTRTAWLLLQTAAVGFQIALEIASGWL